MITYTFTGEELREHLVARAAYHKAKAEEKQAALPELEKSLEVVSKHKNNSVMNSKSRYAFDADDPIEKLEEDIRDHSAKAHRFSLFAKHLPNEKYELTISQLKREIADLEACIENRKLILADVEKQIVSDILMSED